MTETWAPDQTQNGTEERQKTSKARVKFGPKAHQTVPHEWAESMLSHLFATNRKTFGAMLQHAAGTDED